MKYSCYQDCSVIHGWFVYCAFLITITIQREIAKSTIKLVSQRRRNRLLGLQAAVDKRATDRKNRPIHELTITVEKFIYCLLR